MDVQTIDVPRGSRPNLATERVKRRLSIGQAADLIGVHRNSWSGWELGRYTPDTMNLLKICKLFDADPEYLLERAE